MTLHFVFRWKEHGERIHVTMFGGSDVQTRHRARPRLGTFTMDTEQWRAFQMGRDQVTVEFQKDIS